MGEVHACLVVDLPLPFDYGHSWRYSTELDEPFFWGWWGSLKNRTLGFKIQKESRTFCFMVLWPAFCWCGGEGKKKNQCMLNT